MISSSATAYHPQRIKTFQQLLVVLIDSLMLVTAFVLGYLARSTLPLLDLPINPPPLTRYLPMLAIHTITIVVFFYLARMYHMKRAISRVDVFYAIAQNVSIGTFIAVAIETMAFKNSSFDLDYPRGVIVYAWFFSIVLVIAGRELHRQFVVRLRKTGLGRDRVLIVGVDEVARDIVGLIRRAPQFGYEVVGMICGQNQTPPKDEEWSHLYLGELDDLTDIIDATQTNEVIIALPDASRQELLNIISHCQRGTVEIKIFPDTLAFVTGSLTVDDLGGLPLLNVRDIALRGWKLSLKRGLDFVGALFGLIFLSPVFLLISFLIWWQDHGPVFFTQERVGLDGKPFPMIKFRTMRVDAEKYGKWTVENDPRISPIGAFLRRTNLDELPNLINVLFGQMSLVGPRPEQVQFVEEFKKSIPRYMERHREKSGMTGWAQVNGYRGDTSIQERLQYDLYYVENWSLWFDIKIILRTIAQTVLFRNRNAY